MLRKAALLARDHGGERNELSRSADGRRILRETLPAYRNALSPRLSLVDASKRGLPTLTTLGAMRQGNAGMFFLGEELAAGSDGSVCDQDANPHVAKIRVDRSWMVWAWERTRSPKWFAEWLTRRHWASSRTGTPGRSIGWTAPGSVSAANCHFRSEKH